MGAADPTIFDYCNGSSRPSDRDIFDALRLNPKVRICPLSGAAVPARDASVTRRRAARLRPIALRLLNPLDGRLRSTGTCSTPAPRCTRPSFTATCKLMRGRVARTRQRAETIISSACPTHFPRSTTAVLLAAALTFPPLASIAKATDANVMPLISTAFH